VAARRFWSIRVRKILNCYNKATADEWLDVMRQAHRAGLRTTATMMYGTVETPEERLEHFVPIARAAG
jgi:2-iminoacetate synthase ThiH